MICAVVAASWCAVLKLKRLAHSLPSQTVSSSCTDGRIFSLLKVSSPFVAYSSPTSPLRARPPIIRSPSATHHHRREEAHEASWASRFPQEKRPRPQHHGIQLERVHVDPCDDPKRPSGVSSPALGAGRNQPGFPVSQSPRPEHFQQGRQSTARFTFARCRCQCQWSRRPKPSTRAGLRRLQCLP